MSTWYLGNPTGPVYTGVGDQSAQDPLFVDASAGNHTLNAESPPAPGRGGPLTLTQSVGRGRVIPVQDSSTFNDGFQVTAGDRSRVGGARARVVRIPDATTLVVDRDPSWASSAPVTFDYPDRGTTKQ